MAALEVGMGDGCTNGPKTVRECSVGKEQAMGGGLGAHNL